MSRASRVSLPCVSKEEANGLKSILMPEDPEFSWSNGKHLKKYMNVLVKEVQHKRNKRKKELLRNALIQGRDEVLSKLEKPRSLSAGEKCDDECLWQGNVFHRLPSNTCPPIHKLENLMCPSHKNIAELETNQEISPTQDTTSNVNSKGPKINLPKHEIGQKISPDLNDNKRKSSYVGNLEKSTRSKDDYVIKIKGPKNRWVSYPQSTLYIEGTHRPRPLSSATVFLKTSFATEDMQNLTYVPYFGDDDKEDVVSELFDIKDRETMVDLGAEYQQNDTYDTLDEILSTFIKRFGEEIYLCFVGEKEEEQNYKNDKSKAKKEKQSKSATHGKQKGSKIISSLDGFLRKIQKNIASILQIRDEYVIERFNLAFPDGLNYDSLTKVCNSSSKNEETYRSNSIPLNTKIITNYSSKNANLKSIQEPLNLVLQPTLSYEVLMDSYRSLFCRRCFSYDCNIHGNLPTPDLTLQGELASLKEIENDRNDSSPLPKPNELVSIENNLANKEVEKVGIFSAFSSFVQNTIVAATTFNEPSANLSGSKRNVSAVQSSMEDFKEFSKPMPLSSFQKSLFERAFLVFRGDSKRIASAIGSHPDTVSNFIQEQNMKLPAAKYVISNERIDCAPKKKKARRPEVYTSMKNYNIAWLKRVQEAEIHPSFLPCDHTEPCSEKTCSCVRNAFFCTKHCVWGQKSRNFFRGCACKAGQCRTKSCSCFAAKRECDPDLCRTCGACTDEPNAEAKDQRCRNDNIGMRRHCHLLLAESSIEDAGWGLYTKNALKKGDFVHEYIGEIISQEEAERRGRIYDKVNRSYLFNLSSDYVVDASRKGNKTKFANHSSKPNCYTRMVSVNGDIRIGLFAKEDIEPQSELFFDYRYDVTMDNDLLIKPGKTVDWMKNPKMANQISKKYAESEINGAK